MSWILDKSIVLGHLLYLVYLVALVGYVAHIFNGFHVANVCDHDH